MHVRKLLTIFCIGIILYSACSKQRPVSPVKNSFKISINPGISYGATSTWQQVVGGEGIITFTPSNTDTLSAVSDSLSLANVASYNKQVFAGTYSIGLKTKSTAIADTFIRFNAVVNNLLINQDQAISFQATTADGVITINKSLIDTTVIPTFTPAGSASPSIFGKAKGYYFVYVSGNTTGRITFVDATTSYTYLKDLTVNAMAQYDLSPVINKTDVVVRSHSFQPKAYIKKTNL